MPNNSRNTSRDTKKGTGTKMPKTPTSAASDAKKKLKPLILHLDKKDLSTNEEENDELYSSTVQTPIPTSKSVKSGDNNDAMRI
jgi:hypothetical protein